jgi:hypothetical protein
VRYRSGDVFQIPLPNGTFGYGRILLDAFRLRRAGVFDPRCELTGLCGSGLLVQLYRRAFAEPLAAVEVLRRSPPFLDEFLDHTQIYRAEFPIVGNLPVTAPEIDFPEYVICHSPGWHIMFGKGGIVAEIPISFEDCEALPKPSIGLGLAPDWVLKNIQARSGRRRRAGNDLRVHRRRKEILGLAGLSPAMSYDEMCARVGGPTAEELLSLLP